MAGNMPAFSDQLTVDEVIQVLAYIKTFWSDETLAVQIDRTQQVAEQ